IKLGIKRAALLERLFGVVEVPAFPCTQLHHPPIVEATTFALHELQGGCILCAHFQLDFFTQEHQHPPRVPDELRSRRGLHPPEPRRRTCLFVECSRWDTFDDVVSACLHCTFFPRPVKRYPSMHQVLPSLDICIHFSSQFSFSFIFIERKMFLSPVC